jgi:hypothetical protein
MTIREALDIVVKESGHEWYRRLCDPSSKDYRQEYIGFVINRAEEITNTTRSRRQTKPRMPLGVSQKPPTNCVECQNKKK